MKRGSSGLSLLVAVDKPTAMTSHDVVNRVRRIFEEKRVGHSGTLDPMATGVLPLGIGPATRLTSYLTSQFKTYAVKIAFGCETSTDDSEGMITKTAAVPKLLFDGEFAAATITGLVGTSMQVPPQYSAIKSGGVKAYEAARKGKEVALDARPIEITEARLTGVESQPEILDAPVVWSAILTVSKGAYIRAIARDLGRDLGTCAHVCSLQRLSSGPITLEDCVSLDTLSQLKEQCALDPVKLLACPFFHGDSIAKLMENGNVVPAAEVALMQFPKGECNSVSACCTAMANPFEGQLTEGQMVAGLFENSLKALYGFDSAANVLRPDCVFSTAVYRG